MEVVYMNFMIDRIMEVKKAAEKEGRTIDYIMFTKDEYQKLVDELRKMDLLPLPHPALEPWKCVVFGIDCFKENTPHG